MLFCVDLIERANLLLHWQQKMLSFAIDFSFTFVYLQVIFLSPFEAEYKKLILIHQVYQKIIFTSFESRCKVPSVCSSSLQSGKPRVRVCL